MNSLSSLILSLVRSTSPKSSPRPRRRLYLEALEDRTVPTTISVANASMTEIGNVSAFIAAGSGGLSQPKDLVLGPDGSLYVANGDGSVLRYNASTGALIGTFVAPGTGGLNNPYGLTFGPDGNLYVSSRGTDNAILSYNGTTGAFIDAFVPTGADGLAGPAGITFGADGNLYVVSNGTSSVLRFKGPLGPSPGSPLPSSGQTGATFVAAGSGGLAGPADLIFGPDGNLYVSSQSTDQAVLKFDGNTGNFISTYVTPGEGGLVTPRGLAFDQDGRLCVADVGNNAIHRYDSTGQYIDDPVVSGTTSQRSPIGIIFDAQGALLVSSRDTNTIGRYNGGTVMTLSAASATPVSVSYATADGTATAGRDYTAETGTVTFAPGQTSRLVLLVTHYDSTVDGNETFSVQLSNPTGATISTGSATVTIVDPSWPVLSIANSLAIEADTTAHYRGAFVQSPGNQFNPITFGPDGNLYTAVGTGPGYNTIQRYNGTTGAFMGTFASGPINGVRTIVFRGGYMYVASEYTNQVLQYDATSGTYIGVFANAGSGGISGNHGMAFGPDGNLYVSGRNSNNVIEYNGTTGALIGSFVAAGSGGLDLPEGIAFDSSGTYLYVASSGSGQILKYNASTGGFVGVGASSGLGTPHNVAFGLDGLMYVSSGGNNRILRFMENGTYVDDYVPAGSGTLNDPHWMAFGPNGDLYVGGTGSDDQIHRYGTENEARINVSLSTTFAEPVTVSYATADGTAHAGTNYTATSGTITFPPGITTKTIRVPILDSGSQTTPLSFTITLSNPAGATLSLSQATGTIAPSDAAAKFYVVNGAASSNGGTNTIYKYQPSGAAQAPYGLSVTTANPDLSPRGVAANAAGTMEWVVDANKNVYVYSPGGTLLGSWSAGGLSSSAQLTGIATNGTDIWLVDSYSDKVYKYASAASRRSGSQTASSSFSLAGGHSGNTNPQDLVTDGTSFWVVDGTAHKVFKYTLSGSSLGSWAIDPANTHPTGLTINPNSVSDLWIVDNGTDKVYQYVGAAGRTSGSQNAAATFALAPGDTNPQGIADPPPADLLLPPAAPSPALSLPSAPVLNVVASAGPSTSPDVPSLAGRDAVFALLVRESGQAFSGSALGLPAGGALTPPLDLPGLAADRFDGQNPPDSFTLLTAEGGRGVGSPRGAAGLWDGPWADADSPASAAATDFLFARAADGTAAE